MSEKEVKILELLLEKDAHYSHVELRNKINGTIQLFDFDSKEVNVESIIFEYEKQKGIKTFNPNILSNNYNESKWFEVTQNSIGDDKPSLEYFHRYKESLKKQRFPIYTIKQIELNCEKILAKCANPKSSFESINNKRKGLVIGDVQSGKTANYLGLINMAIDYGYTFIIILSGMTEYLRQQTQKRVDSGVIGVKSETISSSEVVYVGVGDISRKNQYYAIPVTTTAQDFITFVKKNTNWRQRDTNKPVVIVSKKNSSVLTQISDWVISEDVNLHSQNVLIIDDEADNASINTKKNSESPSKINGLIRDIYNKVNIASYVGYTATPFANIFINPEHEDLENDDLFPSDFIVQLNSDSSYFGFDKVFNENKVHLISSGEANYLDPKHKKNELFQINESMKNAIRIFLLTNVVRTLKGNGTAHRSMMINISVYNMVQDLIQQEVRTFIEKISLDIEQTSYMSDEKFFREPEMKKIYDLYQTDSMFENYRSEYHWIDIKNGLHDEISKFEVEVFNNKNVKYNFEERERTGARLIAIGGYVLSRGLTLEGLNVSYFNRRASAYDTMLQMCRWFGYRIGYEDLCRVYMTQTSYDNFGAVMDALRDLKIQFQEMELKKKKPIDFGMMVKQSPETLETDLLITSKNKMIHSKELSIGLNYGGVVTDTSKIFKDPRLNNHNSTIIRNFVETIKQEGILLEDVRVATENSRAVRKMYRDVPKKFIASLISEIKVPIENRKFDVESFSEYIKDSQIFEKWDVVIAEGNKRDGALKYILSGTEMTTISRKTNVISDPEEDFFRMGGSNNRLLEPGIFNSGLTSEQINEAKEIALREHQETDRSSDLVAKDYLRVYGRKPLVVIYPIELEKTEAFKDYSNVPLIGFGIGFPAKEDPVIVKYKANNVKLEELRKSRLQSMFDEEDYEDD